ncbi:MAG TPA: 4-(cytidine 5'-diphospho)-2-C-methyl-D-erythritol kinase [Candidatus Limnocylindrales bacterium]|nr:4-(cytidine 5'-diphospho)-2-C-methyl-D-erythritol kinase [Candidatus Limnocylindrales bacterium]
MSTSRQARVRALAKINLDLRVLGKRADGFHELRTVFQTISLGDTLDIAFTPGRKRSVDLVDALSIPDNLVTRAAHAVMDALRINGRVEMRLTKRIPMGAGLGGGSSDAAAVLLALPAIAGRTVDPAALREIGQSLGSDVPFFLLGGAAVGIGRGTELFPLPDTPAGYGIVVAPGIHVNTAQAYRDLSPLLADADGKVNAFQTAAWSGQTGVNDFESVVFAQHPELAAWKKRIVRAGATAAMMTGSGSALFGFFASRQAARQALERLRPFDAAVFPISSVNRARYRQMWQKWLFDKGM